MDHKAKEPPQVMTAKEREESLIAQLEELRKEDTLNCRLVCEHFLERRSIQDLAAETGLTVNAISCRIRRTLKKMRDRLRE